MVDCPSSVKKGRKVSRTERGGEERKAERRGGKSREERGRGENRGQRRREEREGKEERGRDRREKGCKRRERERENEIVREIRGWGKGGERKGKSEGVCAYPYLNSSIQGFGFISFDEFQPSSTFHLRRGGEVIYLFVMFFN